MKQKRPFYKRIWFWVISAICFFAILGSYYNHNQKTPPNIKAQINKFNISDEIFIHFINVGQADSIFIDAGDTDILIDAGNREDGDLVVKYLKQLETDDIELIIATHPHEDHIGGMIDVINNFDVDLILKPGIDSIETKTSKDFEEIIDRKKINNEIPSFEKQYVFGDLVLTILSDSRNLYSETNDFSIVCRVDYLNTSFIFTGDAESPVEHDIIKSNVNLKADVLKIGHHGSASSTTALFLHKISPKYAIISVGNNNKYGLPDGLIINRLKINGIETLRTDQDGTIIIKSDGVNLTLIKENNNTLIEEEKEEDTKQQTSDIQITALDKKGESITITNKGESDINLSGWYILSTKGEQIFYFPKNYIFKAKQTINIVGYGKKDTGDFNWEEGKGIWNNSANDDAKLFDNHINLISYFDDGI